MRQSPNSLPDRRTALTAFGAFGLLGLIGHASQSSQPTSATPAQASGASAGWDAAKGEFVLPALPYAADALEPAIDAETMKIHHGKHHNAYVEGANRALVELARIREGQVEPAFVKFWSGELAFNGSGHVNHTLFWHLMAPPGAGGGGEPTGDLASAITRDFGGFEKFAAHFKAAAARVEASGWGWLVYHPMADKLFILQGEKQQDATLWGGVPILGIDMWEHAYYLKYQNQRPLYINAFMSVINWKFVGSLYDAARARQVR
jgi:Fe-Mn family superoxide dismutase